MYFSFSYFKTSCCRTSIFVALYYETMWSFYLSFILLVSCLCGFVFIIPYFLVLDSFSFLLPSGQQNGGSLFDSKPSKTPFKEQTSIVKCQGLPSRDLSQIPC